METKTPPRPTLGAKNLGNDLGTVNLLEVAYAEGADQATADRIAALEAALAKDSKNLGRSPRGTLKAATGASYGPYEKAGKPLLRHWKPRQRQG